MIMTVNLKKTLKIKRESTVTILSKRKRSKINITLIIQ